MKKTRIVLKPVQTRCGSAFNLQEIVDACSADGDWRTLDGEELSNHVVAKYIEFALAGNFIIGSRLDELWDVWGKKVDASARSATVNNLSEIVEDYNGEGVAALMPFILLDADGTVSSTAAMNVALLINPENEDPMTGVRYVADMILKSDLTDERKGAALMGLLLLGDQRADSILDAAWNALPDKGRLVMTRWTAPVTFREVVEFWVRCLERGCGEEVFGAVVAALCAMPFVAQVPNVFRIERVFPSFSAGAEPIIKLGHSSFRECALELKERLDKIAATESEPKLVPGIFNYWK